MFVAALLAPAQVSAGTIGINGSILTATADPSGDQVLVGFTSGTDLTLAGLLLDVVTPGCLDQGAIVCSLLGLTEVRIVMGGGDDVVDLSQVGSFAGLVFSVVLGDGDDVLLAPAGSSRAWGGLGDDVLIGQGQGSCLSGGSGQNIVIDSSCDPGPEPVFPPARPEPVPEPTMSFLLTSGLAAWWLMGRSRPASLSGARKR